MAGLLDFIGTPEGQGLLSAAFGGLASARRGAPLNAIGAGGIAGLQGYDNARQYQDNASVRQLRDLQVTKAQQDIADANAARSFNFGQYYQTPSQQALANGQGPTVENAAAIPKFQPKLDTNGLVAGLMSSGNPALQQQGLTMLTKDETPITLAEGGKLVTRTGREIAANPKAPELKNGYIVPDGKGGYTIDQALFAAEKVLKSTGAPKVSVSPTVKVGNTFAEGVAKQGADRLFSQVDAASTAPQTAQNAQSIISALDSGKVMAGPLTKWKIAGTQLFGGDPEKLTATRQTIQGLARLSMAGRQSLKGQGQISDYEGKLLANAESGNIDDMTVDEIRLIANGAKKNADYLYKQGQKSAAALKAMPEFNSILPAFDLPPMPSNGNASSLSSGGWSATVVK